MPTTILEPGQIEAAAGAIPNLRFPALGLFTGRARRLRALASGHSLEGFLNFKPDGAFAPSRILLQLCVTRAVVDTDRPQTARTGLQTPSRAA
jgi:FdhE protein